MPGDAATPEQRKEIGAILKDRRAAIDPRYGNRELFLRERAHGVASRSFYAIEGGERGGYNATTVQAFTVAYELPAGWLAAALAGDIAPLPPPGLGPAEIVEAIRWLADSENEGLLDEVERRLVVSDLPPDVRDAMWTAWRKIRGIGGDANRDGPPARDTG